MATYRNALGQIDPYKSDWTSGSWSGTINPGDASNGMGSDSVSPTGFQYNPLLMDWWNQQGFQGNAFQAGPGDARFDQPQMTPELAAWAQANGYSPGFSEGYGGILKNGQIQPGTALGNRTNDDAFMAAALLAGGVVGGAAYGAAGAAGGAGAEGGLIGGDLMAGYGSGAMGGDMAAGLVAPGGVGSGAGLVAPGAFEAGGGLMSGAGSTYMGASNTGTGAGAGDYGLVDAAGDPTRAALYGDGGYGAGMTGGETAAYDTALKAAGGTAGGSSLGSSLGDFFSGKGNVSDYGRLAQGLIGLVGQNRASNAAQQGQADQLALIREAMAQNQPLINTRNNALGGINALMADPSSITKNPDYQFAMKESLTPFQNSMAAKGGYYSGQQIKGTIDRASNVANSKLDQSLNRLTTVAGLGNVGGAQNNALSLNLGQGAANMGNIRAGGYIGAANTAGSTLGDWTNDWINRKTWGGGG